MTASFAIDGGGCETSEFALEILKVSIQDVSKFSVDEGLGVHSILPFRTTPMPMRVMSTMTRISIVNSCLRRWCCGLEEHLARSKLFACGKKSRA